MDIPSRELRNDIGAVLRRVEAGEELRITVRGRPVARLAPLPCRPETIATSVLFDELERKAADPALGGELGDAFPDTTDDL